MPQDIRLWKVTEGDLLTEIQQTSLDFEARLHAWLESDISIISQDLLVIGSEVQTDYGGYIDLLCIDADGDLIVVELKRGLTPREVVAQTLDYASWVAELSNPRITDIANQYFQTKTNSTTVTLETVFAQKFNCELPSTLNTEHSLLIVASQIDNSSERIINYLSRTHGININAMTFQYFRQDKDEMVGRVFLIEPNVVEQATQEKSISKRKPNLSYEALQELADQQGETNGAVYKMLVQGLVPKVFSRTSTNLSSISFNGGYSQSKNAAIFSLIVTESDSSQGLKFRVYSRRLAEYIGVKENQILSWLPKSHIDWKNYANAPPEWSGYEGFFVNVEEANKFLQGLTEAQNQGLTEVQK
jgi:hypothetical protein